MLFEEVIERRTWCDSTFGIKDWWEQEVGWGGRTDCRSKKENIAAQEDRFGTYALQRYCWAKPYLENRKWHEKSLSQVFVVAWFQKESSLVRDNCSPHTFR